MSEKPASELVHSPTEATSVALLRPLQPAVLIEQHDQIEKFIAGALKKGSDYDVLPGTDRECLLKPGAERILVAFSCTARYRIAEAEVDHDRMVDFETAKWQTMPKPATQEETDRLKATGNYRFTKNDKGNWIWQEKHAERGTSRGLYRYVIVCEVLHQGKVVGEGVGACSTMETKYIRNPRDAENTVLKMAQKRALVAASLGTFGLSGRFTQDVEEREQPAPAQHDAQPAAEQEPEPDFTPLIDEAKKWLRTIGVGRDGFAELVRHCNANDIAFHEIVFEARDAGCTTVEEIISGKKAEPAAEPAAPSEPDPFGIPMTKEQQDMARLACRRKGWTLDEVVEHAQNEGVVDHEGLRLYIEGLQTLTGGGQ